MSFWERHRSALSLMAVALFLLLFFYLWQIRTALADTSGLRKRIGSCREALARYYPEINQPSRARERPRLADERRLIAERRAEYDAHLEKLKERSRFPFNSDEFRYSRIPAGMKAGLHLSTSHDDVRHRVSYYGLPGRRTKFCDDELKKIRWLEFKPPRIGLDKVTPAEAEPELRKLCLAERIAKLAVDSGISWVIKVTPLPIAHEAAPGYDNRFIVSYPVSISMSGPVDAVVRFFHSVRQDKSFLVIRSFKLVSVEDPSLPGEMRALCAPGEVYVEISAACMDFLKEQPATAAARPIAVPPPVGDVPQPVGP